MRGAYSFPTMAAAMLLSTILCETESFTVPRQRGATTVQSTCLGAKGFGDTPERKKKPSSSSKGPSGDPGATSTRNAPAAATVPSPPMTRVADTSPAVESARSDRAEMNQNQGKLALEKMRRDRAEQRNKELLLMKEVQDADKLVRESPGAAAIPEKVAQRMGKRMLPFVGIPLFGSMGAFIGFWYFATYRDLEFQPALVAASTIVSLAVGLIGITYSIMSTSWDEDREGTLLGKDEFSKNIDNIKEGLSRSKQNEFLREEARKVPAAEFARLEKKSQESKSKKAQSFGEKMGDDMN